MEKYTLQLEALPALASFAPTQQPTGEQALGSWHTSTGNTNVAFLWF